MASIDCWDTTQYKHLKISWRTENGGPHRTLDPYVLYWKVSRAWKEICIYTITHPWRISFHHLPLEELAFVRNAMNRIPHVYIVYTYRLDVADPTCWWFADWWFVDDSLMIRWWFLFIEDSEYWGYVDYWFIWLYSTFSELTQCVLHMGCMYCIWGTALATYSEAKTIQHVWKQLSSLNAEIRSIE